MPMQELFPGHVYQLIEPGPVVLLTTSDDGRPNIMTMSWHMMVEFTPPRIACVVSPSDFSFAALRRTRECVIAIPDVSLAPKVVGIGNSTGREVDKFTRFALTPAPARKVRPPLVAECFANLECRVIDTRLVNAHALFVLEVEQAWLSDEIWPDPATPPPRTIHHAGYGRFLVDGETIVLESRMP